MANNKPPIQGEGDYEAARRYNQRTADFVKKVPIPPSAAPTSEAEAAELLKAEREGASRSLTGAQRPVRSLRDLWSKVRHIDIAMLTTVDDDGTLHCRPMATQAVEHEEFLWFVSSKDSGKVQAIRANPAVGLAYADPEKHVYIMASGNARITDSDHKTRQLWSKAAGDWFPVGPEDSGLVLICVDVNHAQCWDGGESSTFTLT